MALCIFLVLVLRYTKVLWLTLVDQTVVGCGALPKGEVYARELYEDEMKRMKKKKERWEELIAGQMAKIKPFL